MFSAEEYSAAIDRLICSLETLNDLSDPAMPEAMREICSLLRIGRAEVGIIKSSDQHIMQDELYVLFDCGNADMNDPIQSEHTVGHGNTAVYSFFRRKGEDNWSTAEKAKIDVLGKLIFSFNGRTDLMKISKKLIFTDPQLGMRNMSFFIKNLEELIRSGETEKYTACYFNLRRFSLVNNQAGREAGTAVMKDFIDGLQDIFGKNEYVCRVGGDNFVAIFENEKLEKVIEYLSGTRITAPILDAPFMISAYQGYTRLSSDNIIVPTDAMDKMGLALSTAKKNPNVPYVMYNEDIRYSINRAKAIEDMFPDAVKNEEFLVYYQPKVNLKDYSLIGAEALCRWNHNGSMIQPNNFIPVLEQSKLICKLDFYVLDHVCADIRRWIDEGRRAVRVSVNFSRIHLGDENLLDEIMSIIDRHGVPHEYIEIELTETTTDVDYTELKKIVNGLMEQNVNTSVDDFGIGYSSLNLIRELPWNVLKIDKSFLPDGTENSKQKNTMLKYVIAMAHDLGLECIVEGVETVEQVMLLKENSCFLVQGFFFDRPLPKDIFEDRLDGK